MTLEQEKFGRVATLNFVPKIIHAGTLAQETGTIHYTILTLLPGDDFVDAYPETSAAQQKRLGKEIAGFLDRLQELTGMHYDIGLYVAALPHFPGTWREGHQKYWERLKQESENLPLKPGSIQAFESAYRFLQASIAVLDFQAGPKLLHNDSHPKNILLDRGKLSGVIDWECSQFGEADFELCHVLHWCLYPPKPGMDFRTFLGALFEASPQCTQVPNLAQRLTIVTVCSPVKFQTWEGPCAVSLLATNPLQLRTLCRYKDQRTRRFILPVNFRRFLCRRFALPGVLFLLLMIAVAIIVFLPIFSQAPISSALPLQCEVRISDPASGLIEVRMEFPADALRGRSYLALTFWDLRRNPEALQSVSAWIDNQPLAVTRPFWKGAHERRILLGDVSGTVVVEYRLDPIYYAPGAQVTEPADAVSRVTADLAVLRTTSSFPVMNPAGLTIRAVFRLPTEWVAVTPWQADGDGFLIPPEQQTMEYVALGPFQVQEITVGDATMRVGVLPAADAIPLETADSIIRFELDLIGAPPRGVGNVYTAILVPQEFMNGGSAGDHSTVQIPQPDTLAHEMFHWWNNSSHTKQEAKWFQEGFTEYYGIKIARDAGAWFPEQAEQCLADLNGEMRFLEKDNPRSLTDVSRNAMRDSYARRLVYSKGALFALLLDRQLQGQGRSLDEVVRVVLSDPRQGLDNDSLKATFYDVYGGMVDLAFDAYVKKGDALPDLGLGPASGDSGCARYLPEK